MSEVTNLPVKAPELRSGGAIRAIVPQSMDEAYRLAKAVCMSGLAPRGLDKPESAMVAIMHGMEIGLTPMMALQKIAVINGRPTLWGDGALGLVRGSGLCKYVKEWTEGTGDARTAHCETQRNGEPEPQRRSFSIGDAKKAGLWGKQGPWQQFPERMLQMRARAFTLRDTYADVLGGMYLAEELQGTEVDRGGHIPSAPALAPPPAPPPSPAAKATVLAAVAQATQPAAQAADHWTEYFDMQQAELSGAKTAHDKQIINETVHDSINGAVERGELTDGDAELLRAKWDEIAE